MTSQRNFSLLDMLLTLLILLLFIMFAVFEAAIGHLSLISMLDDGAIHRDRLADASASSDAL